METIVLVIHLILAVALVGTVLIQRSEGGGLGIGGGGAGGGLMSVRGTANLLTRITAVLAAGFMATSLTLAIIAGHAKKPTSILDTPAGTAAPVQPETPEKPAAPLSQ
ncbi:MAG: preprotein translocase subunit SecG [Gammaproteobacteria bacterium]